MIILTRLGAGGLPVAVNPDLIERADRTPDTVITLVDGHKFVVTESIEEVVEMVRAWRASVAAEAFALTQARRAADLDGDEIFQTAPRPSGQGRGPAVPNGEGAKDDLDAHSTLSTLAQVLHLPRRED